MLWLALAYGVVVVATVLRQFPRLSSSALFRWDSVGVVPGFSFFAPNPGNRDFQLVYRAVGTEGRTGQWHDPFAFEPRSGLTAVWNPRKRTRKAILDIAGSLAAEAQASEADDRLLVLSVPYLLLLDFATEQVRASGASHVQFAVVASSVGDLGRRREFELLFASRVHDVSSDAS